MKKNIYLFIIPFLICIFLTSFTAKALPTDFFAEKSVLAEGKWVKMEVTESGIQFVPVATLRAMGFTDMNAVNVFGTGGRPLPEALTTSMTDDLPLLPCVRTDKGIYFFGHNHILWQTAYDVPFSHTLNAYDTKSYYFLSDTKVEKKEMQRVAAPQHASTPVTTFTERMLHESEIAAPEESGRNLFGEDFRSTRTNSFTFPISNISGNNATVKVRFGAKSTSLTSIMMTANGVKIPSSTSDQIQPSASTDFLKLATSTNVINLSGDQLKLDLTYSPAGTVSFARLDYIEVFYPRFLRLGNDQLYFYISNPSSNAASIEGCLPSSRIWDVTDPANPKEMEMSLSGSSALISLSGEYQEFIAFNPDKIPQTSIKWERVENQDIHGLPTPDMVIITFDEYMEGAKRIAALHEEHDGMKVEVIRAEDIYNEFSGGSADVTAFRKMLKMWHDRGGERTLRYCLLMGRPYFDNRVLTTAAKNLGYRPLPIWEEPVLMTDNGSYSTDSYLAMLDDSPVGFNMASAIHRIAVGRLPVTSSQEALEVAAKIEKYVKNPEYGSWRNKMMFIADDIDKSSQADTPVGTSTFFDQTQKVYETLKSTKEGSKYIYDRVLLDAHKLEFTALGNRYPSAHSKIISNINEGVVFTNYLGHASPHSWTEEKILTMDDINSFSNRNLTFLFGGTCEFGRWDSSTISGGEIMVMNPTAGAIAMVIPSRLVYITQNYYLNKAMIPYLLKETETGDRPRIGDFFRRGMNEQSETNKLRYCLIGDPAIAFPLPINTVNFETLDGKDISDTSGDFPELSALSKAEVTGTIRKPSGEVDEEFSGSLELILFDAENVVNTKNLGKGLDRTYNERKTRLTTASVNVENGKWTARLLLPSEIENNYSPAMITAYAWNKRTGEEAHGATENLYVYGYDENPDADEKAPEIEKFYINSPAFQNGGVVNANPIVFAYVADESGINISDAGIGHQMMLTLDEKKIFTDLNRFFSADISREGAGSICYPLEDLEPGKHTLTLSVWDNANNSVTRTLEFNVGAAVDPIITDLNTNVNPASTSVVFNISIDRPNSMVNCLIEVFDLAGRVVWTADRNLTTDMQSSLSASWDLRDSSGVRVPRGIYLYRATVKTPEGTYSSKSKKLAVTAQ